MTVARLIEFVVFAIAVMVIAVGFASIRKFRNGKRGEKPDSSVWLLTILLVAALLSISSFVAYFFLLDIH